VTLVVFEVEHAGCESCAARVRRALEDLASVVEITIDEEADSATVTLARETSASEDEINRALAEASHGSGHAYRVRPGSLKLPH
jgi:copper chaperone CopZ